MNDEFDDDDVPEVNGEVNDDTEPTTAVATKTKRGASKPKTKTAPKTKPVKTKPVKAETEAVDAEVLEDEDAESVASLLKKISDPMRVQIIHILSQGEQRVTALCEYLGQSQPSISHHLALMRESGSVSVRRDGQNKVYKLGPNGKTLAKITASVLKMTKSDD